ncbi:MAG: hypothetical protein PHE27_01860 [Alphaproteobacteria bacterium]|nr:hypothetical protein [Alphaproteobacteria bacterium]
MSFMDKSRNMASSDRGGLEARIAELEGAFAAMSRRLAEVEAQLHISQALLGDFAPSSNGALKRGSFVENEGIFFGEWTPLNDKGQPIGRYILFAAPEDLSDKGGNPLYLSFEDAAVEVASLHNYCGHDGVFYDSEDSLLKALEDGSYKGGWILPPKAIVNGENDENDELSPNTLSANIFNGDFKDTFCLSANENDMNNPCWYYTCSEYRSGQLVWDGKITVVLVKDGDDFWHGRTKDRAACRPCRLVRVPEPR